MFAHFGESTYFPDDFLNSQMEPFTSYFHAGPPSPTLEAMGGSTFSQEEFDDHPFIMSSPELVIKQRKELRLGVNAILIVCH